MTTTTKRSAATGLPLLAPVLAFAVLTVAYPIVNSSTPHLDASGDAVLRYAQANGTAIRVGTCLLFASAVPLAVATAACYQRLRALGVNAPGPAIALVGGVLAAGAPTLSAMFGWAGGNLSADASPDLARALADLSFLSGGPVYAVTFALLIAGISVPGLLPRGLTWTGLVIAAVGMVATLTFLADGFEYTVPVVRFGGMVWLVFVAAMLPRTRPARHSA